MDITEFVSQFADQFMNPNETDFSPETRFHELSGWSSMTALMEIAMMEENYGVTVPSEEIRDAETIQDLFEAVKRNKEKNG
ncbi:MAG: acyl carrier protein [Fibrobacter sp.]|jgi:acyl carrier protein|nr:acyl carrier protein [Fibrobacter sp.]